MSVASYVRPVEIVALGETVAAAARRLRDRHVGCVVVTREARPVGIVTDRDLALRVVAEGRGPETLIDEIVTYDPIVLREADSVETAARRMKEHGVRRLPIVDDAGRVTGIVTADDLLIALGRQLAAVAEAIEDPADAEDSR